MYLMKNTVNLEAFCLDLEDDILVAQEACVIMGGEKKSTFVSLMWESEWQRYFKSHKSMIIQINFYII